VAATGVRAGDVRGRESVVRWRGSGVVRGVGRDMVEEVGWSQGAAEG
jgi:hypothetical protein